eukprot:364812-Chlamydomonas_euryale.AAC.8
MEACMTCMHDTHARMRRLDAAKKNAPSLCSPHARSRELPSSCKRDAPALHVAREAQQQQQPQPWQRQQQRQRQPHPSPRSRWWPFATVASRCVTGLAAW